MASRVNNRLNGRQCWLLTQYTQERYVGSGLSDPGFAAEATTALGFSVTKGNIQGAREALEIPANGTRQAPSADLASLERRVATLEQRIEVYFNGCCNPGAKGTKS